MRISPLSAAAIVVAHTTNRTANACRGRLIVPLPLIYLKPLRASGARPLEKIDAGLGEFGLQPLHQFDDRRRVGDLADALARTPDVAPRLHLHVAAGAEIHLRLV